MFAYCNNNPVMYADPSGELSIPNKIPKAVMKAAPTCDSKILGIIESANLDATTDVYVGDEKLGDFQTYTFNSKFTIKRNQYLWWEWVYIEYTQATYYIEKIDLAEYRRIYDSYADVLSIIDFLTPVLYDFSNCGSIGYLPIDLAQVFTSVFILPGLDTYRNYIESYNTNDELQLRCVVVRTYRNDELYDTDILIP